MTALMTNDGSFEPEEVEEDLLPLVHLDHQFADFLTKLVGTHSNALWRAAALTSQATRRGNICLDLGLVICKGMLEVEVEPARGGTCLSLADWILALKASPAVGVPGQYCPLILDPANRLYLYRYWRYEKLVADFLRSRMFRPPKVVNHQLLKEGLDRLFPGMVQNKIDWQSLAVYAAIRRSLVVITGGPGTGKTATVVKILVLLLEQQEGQPLRVALTAPTGKAAARLQKSISSVKDSLDCADSIRKLIPEEAMTIHRLLGALPNATRYRFNEERLLPHDLVVVDEASMLDLPLMAKLVQALPDSCQLILLGDADQLSSVEPGSILGHLCDPQELRHFSQEFVVQAKGLVGGSVGISITEATEMAGADSFVRLRQSYRFEARSGIAKFSKEVNRGDSQAALKILADENLPDIIWEEMVSSKQWEAMLATRILEEFAKYLKADSVSEAWAVFDQFQILCAQWRGSRGVVAVNQRVEQVLSCAGLIRTGARWYKGQPILVTQNDYRLRVFNGDIGLIFPEKENQESSGKLRAFFPLGNGAFKRVLPSRLPAHQTAYAITVHRSQGSEFDKILLLLPRSSSLVLTRELIYTAITRARKEGEIWGTRDILGQAIERRITQNSGLKDALIAPPLKVEDLQA